MSTIIDDKIWLKESDESGTHAFYGISNDGILANPSILITPKEKVIQATTDTATAQDRQAIQQEIKHLIDQIDENALNAYSPAITAQTSTLDTLRNLKEKAINAVNDTNTEVDREAIQKEINASIQQIDDNALLTFNGKALGNGVRNSIDLDDFSFTNPLSQIVIHSNATGQDIDIRELEIEAIHESSTLAVNAINPSTQPDMQALDNANQAQLPQTDILQLAAQAMLNAANSQAEHQLFYQNASNSAVNINDKIQPEQATAWFGTVQQYNSKVGSALLGLIPSDNDFLL